MSFKRASEMDEAAVPETSRSRFGLTKSVCAAALFLSAAAPAPLPLRAQVGGNHAAASRRKGKALEMTVTQTLEGNKAVVRRIYEDCLNTGRLELLDQFIAEDYEGPDGRKGPAVFGQVIGELRRAFPDIRWTVEDLFAEGDRVAIRWTWRGTQKGAFRGFPASGRQVNDSAVAIYQLRDGKAVRVWIQTDRLGFLQQIGVLPEGLGSPPAAEKN